MVPQDETESLGLGRWQKNELHVQQKSLFETTCSGVCMGNREKKYSVSPR